MKLSRIIHIIIITGLVLIIGIPAQAWTRYQRDRHYYRDRHHSRDYGYNRYRIYNRRYYRNHDSSPYYKSWRPPSYNYSRPQYTDHYTMEDGWDLVKKGRSHTALDVLGQLAKSNPDAGGPKLGYAIASADTGQLSQGVWSMRRALTFGPGAFQQFVLDPRLESRLERLVSKFHGRSHGLPEKDVYFMQASLYYLLNDTNACLAAIEHSKNTNDRSDSAKNLYYMAQNYL